MKIFKNLDSMHLSLHASRVLTSSTFFKQDIAYPLLKQFSNGRKLWIFSIIEFKKWQISYAIDAFNSEILLVARQWELPALGKLAEPSLSNWFKTGKIYNSTNTIDFMVRSLPVLNEFRNRQKRFASPQYLKEWFI